MSYTDVGNNLGYLVNMICIVVEFFELFEIQK